MAEQETRLVLEVGLSEAFARRLEGLFEDAPHDAKEEAMLLDEAWGEIHAAYENGAARLSRFARLTNPEPERDLVRRAVEAWPQFDAPGDEDEPVSGGDLVEWFSIWREQAKDLLAAQPASQPAVFVGVEGGLADYTAFGLVRVVLVDWDAIRDACDDEEALERIAEYREEIAALPDGDFKAGLVAALDVLERRHRGEPEQTALEIAAG